MISIKVKGLMDLMTSYIFLIYTKIIMQFLKNVLPCITWNRFLCHTALMPSCRRAGSRGETAERKRGLSKLDFELSLLPMWVTFNLHTTLPAVHFRRKLKPREIKGRAKAHTASKWQQWHQNYVPPMPKFLLPTKTAARERLLGEQKPKERRGWEMCYTTE